jgi:hypothetical protein
VIHYLDTEQCQQYQNLYTSQNMDISQPNPVPRSITGPPCSVALPKPGKNPKFLQNLHPISLLPSTGKLFEKVILQIVQKHIREKHLLNANQFGFHARHSTTLQCMRLADHVTLNFNNKMSIAVIFLDIKKPFTLCGTPACSISCPN